MRRICSTWFLFALVLGVVFLTACGSNTAVSPTPISANAQPSATPTILSQPAATTAPPPAIVVTENESVTAGSSPPPAPTAVPITDPTPTSTGIPAPTIDIPGLVGPDFPENINPLTGELLSDLSVLARRPLAIKISNAPAIVRPQSGLNNADLVFEHYAEGGLTRFTAVFYSKDANPIGSIRSGRLIDLEIPKMYDAAFAYSGASGPVRLKFQNSEFFDRIISPDFGHGGFFRVEDPNKAFEHTLFTNSFDLRFILDQRGQNRPPQFQNGMTFSPQPAVPGAVASKIEIIYDGTYVTWAYNPGTARYTRWTDGVSHNDANSGQQLAFRNVIVLAAHHQDTDILEDNVGGGNYSIEIQIWGEGPVSLFRDGQRIDGRWRRQDPDDMLAFTDLDGNPLPLAPGNTFFQIVPLGFDRLIVTP